MAGGVSSLNVSAAERWSSMNFRQRRLAARRAEGSAVPNAAVERLNQGNRKAWLMKLSFPALRQSAAAICLQLSFVRANHTCHTTGIGNASSKARSSSPFHQPKRRQTTTQPVPRARCRRSELAPPQDAERQPHLYTFDSTSP